MAKSPVNSIDSSESSEDSSESSEDEILDFAPFRIKSAPLLVKTKTKQSTTTWKQKEPIGLSFDEGHRSEDDDITQVIAKSKAASATLPQGITFTNQLFWYKDPDSRYYPCRVCERSEARIHLNLEPFWDDKESCLIQALDYPPSKPFNNRDRMIVNIPLLTPYNGRNSTKEEWNRAIFKTYARERCLAATMQNIVVIRSDIEATYPYLERIRQAAKQNVTTSIGSTTSDDGDDDDDDCRVATDDESDMEVPYAENLGVDEQFHLQDFSDKKMEPLRPGDVIQYTSPIFVYGDQRGRRRATVLSTDPNRDPMLVLDNGEILPENIIIKRTQVLKNGKLYSHAGCARCIEKFILKKRALKGDFTVRVGLKKEAERLGRIVDRNMLILQQRAQADGFAPMDLLNNYGKRNRSSSENSDHEKSVTDDKSVQSKLPSGITRINSILRTKENTLSLDKRCAYSDLDTDDSLERKERAKTKRAASGKRTPSLCEKSDVGVVNAIQSMSLAVTARKESISGPKKNLSVSKRYVDIALVSDKNDVDMRARRETKKAPTRISKAKSKHHIDSSDSSLPSIEACVMIENGLTRNSQRPSSSDGDKAKQHQQIIVAPIDHSRQFKLSHAFSTSESDSSPQHNMCSSICSPRHEYESRSRFSINDSDTEIDSNSAWQAPQVRNITSAKPQLKQLKEGNAAVESTKTSRMPSNISLSHQRHPHVAFSFTKCNTVIPSLAKCPSQPVQSKQLVRNTKCLYAAGNVDDQVTNKKSTGNTPIMTSTFVETSWHESAKGQKTGMIPKMEYCMIDVAKKKKGKGTKSKCNSSCHKKPRYHGSSEHDVDDQFFQSNFWEVTSHFLNQRHSEKVPMKRAIMKISQPQCHNHSLDDIHDDLWDSSDTDHKMTAKKSILKQLK